MRDISEETGTQQQPRRRSNSLPIPKIEISIFQGSDGKKQDPKDFIEVPEVKDISILTGDNDLLQWHTSAHNVMHKSDAKLSLFTHHQVFWQSVKHISIDLAQNNLVKKETSPNFSQIYALLHYKNNLSIIAVKH